MIKNPQLITDPDLFRIFQYQFRNVNLVNPNFESMYDLLDKYAQYLIDNGLEESTDIELYSPVLSDAIIFKVRITSKTKTTYKFDYSKFWISDDEVLEKFSGSRFEKTKDLGIVFKRIFNDTKCFIPFNRFDIGGDQIMSSDEIIYKVLSEYHTNNHQPSNEES